MEKDPSSTKEGDEEETIDIKNKSNKHEQA